MRIGKAIAIAALLGGVAVTAHADAQVNDAHRAPSTFARTDADARWEEQHAQVLASKPELSIVAALYREHALLVLTEDGRVTSWKEGAASGTPYDAPTGAGAFCEMGGELLVVTAMGGKPGRREVQFWSNGAGAWKSEASFRESEDDTFLALDCTGAEPLLLTTKSLRMPRSRMLRELQGGWLDSRFTLTTLQMNGYLYVGVAIGEFGGGLRRLALSDGKDEPIDASDPAELCGGPLNRRCDPVGGLASDPDHPGCILASVGLEHMMSHGRVLRICGTSIEQIYYKPITWDGEAIPEGREPADSMTAAFYAMAPKDGAVWAAGEDGLYRFGPGDRPDFTPFGHGRSVSPSGIDWSNPDFILVSTYIAPDRRLTAYGLLLVPRGE